MNPKTKLQKARDKVAGLEQSIKDLYSPFKYFELEKAKKKLREVERSINGTQSKLFIYN